MEARIARSILAEETGWVSRVINPRPTTPILQGMLIETTQDGRIRFSATDNSTSSTTTAEADITEHGSFIIPGRLFASIASSLSQKPVDIKLVDSKVIITCGRSEFALPTMPLEDYPKLPQQPDKIGSLHGQDFTDAVHQVVFAAAKDEAHPTLTGTQIRCTDTELILTATDRYRLAMKTVPWKGAAREPFILRAKNLAELARPAHPGVVELSLDPGTTLFGVTTGTRRSTVGMLEGIYPDVERLIPAGGVVSAEVDVADMVDAVKRVRLVMGKTNRPIRLIFGNEEVLLSADSGPDANASEVVAGTVIGERMEMAFNPEYLVEGLMALAGGVGRFTMNGPMKPALLHAPEDPSYRHILMPMKA